MAIKNVNPKKYSRNETDKAGEILRLGTKAKAKEISALEVLSNWRAAHSYPMHVFKMQLKRRSEKINSTAITAQRLKRVPSIVKKLNRVYKGARPTMKLTQMQDIAGCRVVLSNIDEVYSLYKKHYLRRGGEKHIKVNEKDYIESPKIDGYRSIHLVYKYISDKKDKEKYNGLLIEIQIRSELQHVWATAVETVGFFTGQAIKSNEGEVKWHDFFRLVSSAFAMKEGAPLVPNTPRDEKELFEVIKRKEKELNVISKMKEWTASVRFFDDFEGKKNFHYFLLEFDTIQEKLSATAFTTRNEDKAIKAYSEAEKKIYGNSSYDVVLVGADTLSGLKRAYPNYFIDTRDFIKELEKIIRKY